jgi:hypothetical protein
MESVAWLETSLASLRLDIPYDISELEYSSTESLFSTIKEIGQLINELQHIHGPSLMVRHRNTLLLYQHIKTWILQYKDVASSDIEDKYQLSAQSDLVIEFLVRWRAILQRHKRTMKYVL